MYIRGSCIFFPSFTRKAGKGGGLDRCEMLNWDRQERRVEWAEEGRTKANITHTVMRKWGLKRVDKRQTKKEQLPTRYIRSAVSTGLGFYSTFVNQRCSFSNKWFSRSVAVTEL